MKRKVDIEYLDKRLRILKWEKHGDLLQNVAEAGGDICNDFRDWTPLKLCGLSYFAGAYAQILQNLKKRSGNLEIVYIDLFAGSGMNKVNNTLIAGSPLVCIDSVANRQIEFDTMFFNDASPEYCEALRKRLEFLSTTDPFAWISGRCHIMNKDCNEALYEMVNHLRRITYKNYLAFIDPYKWEISWEAMRNLLSIEYGDIMITLQARLIAKEVGRYLTQGSQTTGEKIENFLGEETKEVIGTLNTEKTIKDYYIDKISQYRSFVVDIEIKSGSSYRYYLIFASRRNNPPWKGCITNMKSIVENFSGDLVTHSLDYLEGRTQRLL